MVTPMNPEEIRQKIQEEKSVVDSSQSAAVNNPSSYNTINPQIIYSWKAPLRAYKKTSKGVMRFYFALGLLLCLIAFFLGERILILPIGAVLFLFYVLTITPPPIVENNITKFGIQTPHETYRWEFLSHFYFMKRFDYEQLIIVSHAPYSQHIYLVIKDPEEKEKILKLLSEHLIFLEKPHKTFADKLSDVLTSLMPESDDDEATEIAKTTHERSVPSEPAVRSL